MEITIDVKLDSRRDSFLLGTLGIIAAVLCSVSKQVSITWIAGPMYIIGWYVMISVLVISLYAIRESYKDRVLIGAR